MSPVDNTVDDDHAPRAPADPRPGDTLGRRTGEIVHDFNNLFQGIVGALNVLRAHIAQGRLAEAEQLIDRTTEAVQNAAVASQRILAFARREPTSGSLVDVNAVVACLEPLIRGAAGDGIALTLDLADDPTSVTADRNGIENALMNLVVNARDAMQGAGALTVTTGRRRFDAAGAAAAGGGAAGDYVSLTVSDTGAGLTPAVAARAFDAYFTTKPAGKGTGLGLAMTAEIARGAGGWVRLDSAPGAGATFALYFPAASNIAPLPSSTPSVETTPLRPSRSGESILVVEDEVVVRSLIVDVLRDHGYLVLEAADGPEGLAILLGETPLDLVISDIGLPGLGGREMTEVARARRPDLKIILITGHAQDDPRAGLLSAAATLITKPFAMDALVARVGAMLAGL